MQIEKDIEQVAKWLKEAQAIVINTGAGMGVDSGLPDYRGEGGQWGGVENDTAQSVFEVVNPDNLLANPQYGWKMHATRLQSYREAAPHDGFSVIKSWIERFELPYFIITSNVDGHFQRAGFDPNLIREVHGSLYHLQCSTPCSEDIWPVPCSGKKLLLEIENGNFPKCPKCGALARPNVYMFRDKTYLKNRSDEQAKRYETFLKEIDGKRLLGFEIGSGPHVQSIRMKTRQLIREYNAKVVRINPKDNSIKPPHIGLALGAKEALLRIDGCL